MGAQCVFDSASFADLPEPAMTVCPVAIAVGCKKCPVFGICPLKSVIGDYKPEARAKSEQPPRKAKGGAQKPR
jgi:hypothetical protein